MSHDYQLTSGQLSYLRLRVGDYAADEIAQAVSLRLWRWDCKRGLPTDPIHLDNIMWKSVRQCMADYLRRERRSTVYSLEDVETDSLAAPCGSDSTPDVDVISLLSRAGSCADAVRARYVDGRELTRSEQKDCSRGLARIRESLEIAATD